jgi:hypothetical protein
MEQPVQLRALRSAEFVIAPPSPILVIASSVVYRIAQVNVAFPDAADPPAFVLALAALGHGTKPLSR